MARRRKRKQHRHRIKPVDRPPIVLAEGTLDPRDRFAKDHGISHRTLARKLKPQTKIIGGCAYVWREESKRILAGLEPQPPTHKRNHRSTT
jgi:hypothetical protein